MAYAPDNLERCPEHPDALVRHIYDADFYVWPHGERSAPLNKRTVGFECAACCRPLSAKATGEQS